MSLRRLRFSAALVAFGIILGTVGFHFLENADWYTAFYWMSAEFTLVGANDFTPHTFWGKAVTIVLFWTGVGTVSSVVSAAVNFDARRIRQEFALSKLGYKNHVIVVGPGALGDAVINSLRSEGEKRIVIIDKSSAIVRKLEHAGDFILEGDGASDDVLKAAGIVRA